MLIKEFFKNQEIFITGGSGFIGKALIEKLLRSCPGISKIYVLLRGKKGKTADVRLQEILTTKLFDRVRSEQPESLKKIEVITGDCSELGLGISKEDLKRIQNVTIVYHSAASVRFDDPLKSAVLLNTRGTHEILKIAQTLRSLKVFVHVSTTYCNSERSVIGEEVYKPCVDWRETIKLAETLDEETLDIFNLKYNEFKPNTYTFTKALGEQIVDDYKGKVPVVIYRPSIVVSCLDDPIPGWIDNFNGPMGMLVACGIGILRANDNDGLALSAIIPVDIVIRGMIIATYKKGTESVKKTFESENQLDVYNSVIDSISPISTFDLVEMGRICILENPFERTLWLPGGIFTRCPVIYGVFFFLQLLLSIVLDIILKIVGMKPMILKIQRRMRYAVKAVSVFMRTEWEFKAEKFLSLENIVPRTEYDDFAFLEKSHINYREYVSQGIRGSKEFLLKENPESSPGARTRLRILRVLYYTFVITSYGLLARFIFNWLYKTILKDFY